MKKLILLFSLLFYTIVQTQAQEINWMSMDEALALQQKEPKKIIMDAYTVWCGPCKMMEKNTFHNKDVIAYINKHFYAVKFNAEGRETIHYKGKTFTNPKYNPQRRNTRNYQHDFAKYLRVRAYPTILFFDKKADLITPVVGYLKPQQLELYLKFIAKNKYKKIKSAEDWQKYQQNFKPTFQVEKNQ